MDRLDHYEDARIATARTAFALGKNAMKIRQDRGVGPRPGDVYLLREIDLDGVEWVVVDHRGDRFHIIPVDVHPFVGSRDLELDPEVLGGVAYLRCDLMFWINSDRFEPQLRTGRLPPDQLDRVRRKQHDIKSGKVRVSMSEEEIDGDPTYCRWRDSLRGAYASLAKDQTSQRLPVSLWRPRNWGSFALAASIIIALALGWNVRELHQALSSVQQHNMELEERQISHLEWIDDQRQQLELQQQQLEEAEIETQHWQLEYKELFGSSGSEKDELLARITELHDTLQARRLQLESQRQQLEAATEIAQRWKSEYQGLTRISRNEKSRLLSQIAELENVLNSTGINSNEPRFDLTYNDDLEPTPSTIPLAMASGGGTTAFNFQGQLKIDGLLAEGKFNLMFNLFDGPDPFESKQIGFDQELNIPVENGIFVVSLDFGPGIFDGREVWLQIIVQEVGDLDLVTLSQLHQITPVPYATHAVNSSELDGFDSTSFLRKTSGCDICIGHADSEGSSPEREHCFDLSSTGGNDGDFLQLPGDVDENDQMWIWIECPDEYLSPHLDGPPDPATDECHSCSGNAAVLANKVPEPDISGAAGSNAVFTVNVPESATNLTIELAGGTGDADLYVLFDSKPTTTKYECRSWNSDNGETCLFTSPQAGIYHILIHGFTAYSGATLLASYIETAKCGDSMSLPGLNALAGQQLLYTFDVGACATTVTFTLSGGTGAGDLYVRFAGKPSASTYDCRSWSGDSNEVCTFAPAQAGTYHVTVDAYSAFSNATFLARYE